MNPAGAAEPMVSLNEIEAYLRVESGVEEALLAGLNRSASALCEAFINQVGVARPFVERLPQSGGWQVLEAMPVRTIDEVRLVAADGTTTVMPVSAYSFEIDARGCGWVRVTTLASGQHLLVRGSAGLASDANDLPEPLRQGVIRLVAHLFASRDGDGGEPPAAVTALWRPFRRMRLA
jgi:uncharacterized phiE125 gp8 family phage protein